MNARPLSARVVLASIATSLLAACAHQSAPPAVTTPVVTEAPTLTLAERYANAVLDASHPTTASIVTTLAPISTSNPRLRWQGPPGSSRVRVVTWTSWPGYDTQIAQEIALARETWVTAVPEVQDACRASGLTEAALALRLEQTLGLPPESHKTRMVELWVTPRDLFRPCPDAEVSDTECELLFPTDVTPEHRAWIEALRAHSYETPGYPWTQLGYTYDWSESVPQGGHVGPSEYVIRAGSSVQVIAVATTDAYCAPSNE